MPKPFNLRSNEGGPSLTIDNKEIFLTVCSNKDGYNNCDIYYMNIKNIINGQI